LCPHRCTLKDEDAAGFCRVRSGGAAGRLPFYGRISSSAVDPIEKKPLFHYRPGESILSIGFTGCNMRCPFCQNWQISQGTEAAGGFVPPEKIVQRAIALGLKQIAYTYSEPLVHAEYVMDCMAAARSRGIANVLVTNGCVNEKAAAKIIPLADAANIDLKCFSEDGYGKTLAGELSAVKNFITAAFGDIHTEITTLIVPGFNDSEQEIEACIDFIASVSNVIPWHITAYHPAYKWNAAPAKAETIIGIKERAKQKLLYCYTGNINDNNNTFCAECGSALVIRNGYDIKICGLVKTGKNDNTYYCKQCGATTAINY
jgi:pyruvate formate lyase activating enzyme